MDCIIPTVSCDGIASREQREIDDGTTIRTIDGNLVGIIDDVTDLNIDA